MSDDFEVGAYTYRAGRLDTFKQLHLARRVAPLVAVARPIFMRMGSGGSILDLSMDELNPLIEAFSHMSDADTEYVIGTALSVVERKQADGVGYTKVWNTNANALMFQDITMAEIVMICVTVMIKSIGPF